jgi:hypothetical protein
MNGWRVETWPCPREDYSLTAAGPARETGRQGVEEGTMGWRSRARTGGGSHGSPKLLPQAGWQA